MKRTLLILISLCLAGCTLPPASPDSQALSRPVFEPLVNGKLVTIELIRVNGTSAPDQSLKKALDGFDAYIAGNLELAQGESVTLDLGDDGALTRQQFDSVIQSRKHTGPCAITLILVPDFDFSTNKGVYSGHYRVDETSHVIAINGKVMEKMARSLPFVSRQKVWRLVILHELCHSLGLPTDRSHNWDGGHCTHPECVLYPGVDLRSVLTTIIRFGPPLELCSVCKAELKQARLPAGAELIDPDKPYDLLDYLDGLVQLNPNNSRAYSLRAKVHVGLKDYAHAINDMNKAIELDSDNTASLNNLAWLLATCPNPALRDGQRALQLAQRACELSEWKEHNLLDTLAAACAQLGQFNRAIEYQTKAIDLAPEKTSKQYRANLKLYRVGQTAHPTSIPAGQSLHPRTSRTAPSF